MVRCVLILFLLSDWTYTVWSRPFREATPAEVSSPPRHVLPLHQVYKKQVLERVILPPPVLPDSSVTNLPSEPTVGFPALVRANPLVLPSTDPLYALMSLQR